MEPAWDRDFERALYAPARAGNFTDPESQIGAAIFGDGLINAALFRVAPEAQSVVDTIVDPVAPHLLDPAALAPLVQALAGSLRQVYLIACALSIAVLVLAFRIPPRASVLG